jgi:hypothetical protein
VIFGRSEVPETMLHFDAENSRRNVRGSRMRSTTKIKKTNCCDDVGAKVNGA